MIRLFVGTDPQQHVAERALEASVRANTTQPVDITWCRRGEGWWDWGDDGWATPFSLFRWAVPQAAKWEGRAIYMDCDMLALGDLTELWECPIPDDHYAAYAGKGARKADVILWDCERARPFSIGYDNMPRVFQGVRLPNEWDHRDHLEDNTKILHFTKLATQFWKPYPERYPYDIEHPDPRAEALFWQYEGRMCAPIQWLEDSDLSGSQFRPSVFLDALKKLRGWDK